MSTMMDCGCASTATSEGKPACVVHSDAEEAAPPPDLRGRIALCSNKKGCIATAAASQQRSRGGEVQYGEVKPGQIRAQAQSGDDLPFFQHFPEEEHDEYYCGCSGWG